MPVGFNLVLMRIVKRIIAKVIDGKTQQKRYGNQFSQKGNFAEITDK